MKKRMIAAILVALLTLATVSMATAGTGQPQGGCPDNFHLHSVMDMGHDHGDSGQHLHVGNDRDRNGDGYICGKHVSEDGGVHVHIDNNVPLP